MLKKIIKQKAILIVGAGILQIPAIKLAKKKKLYVICTDHNPNAIGFDFCDKKIILSTKNVTGHVKLIKKLSKLYDICSVFTQGTDAAVVVAELCKLLSLPSVSVGAAKISNNKSLFRKCLKKHGIENIKFKVVTTCSGAHRAAKEIGLPVIIKAVDNSGSRGIKKITDLEEIKKSFKKTQSYSSDKKTVLVEEWLDGSEYSVETIQYKNKSYRLGIADRLIGFEPYRVETGHINPSQLGRNDQKKLYELTEKVAKAVGISFGAAKADAMITNDGRFVILEIAARLSGGFHSQYTTPYSTGMNVIKAAMDISLGLDIDKKDVTKTRNKIVVCTSLFPNPGKIIKISGINKIKKMKGIKNLFLLVKKGDVIKNYQNSADRIVYLISEGNSLHESQKNSSNALKKLKIITR